MNDYVIDFEQKYNQAEKHKRELPDAALAFKRLDNALLDDNHKQMALSACKDQTFESIKSALNRLFKPLNLLALLFLT